MGASSSRSEQRSFKDDVKSDLSWTGLQKLIQSNNNKTTTKKKKELKKKKVKKKKEVKKKKKEEKNKRCLLPLRTSRRSSLGSVKGKSKLQQMFSILEPQ